MPFTHGVTTRETATSLFPIRQIDSALPFVVGAAPSGAALESAKLITSYKEFVDTFGAVPSKEQEGDYGLNLFARIFFTLYGVGPIVAVNVLDPDDAAHQTAVAMGEAHTFGADDTIAIGHKGIRTLVVKDSAELVTYVENTDYTLDQATGVITRLGTGSIAQGEAVHVSYSYADAAKVAAADIVGGIDGGTGARTGLELIEEVFPVFGKVPAMIACPGFADDATVIAAMLGKTTYYSGLFKAFVLIDVPAAQATPAAAITWKNTYSSEHAVVLWPQVKVGSETHPASIHAAGLMAKTDLEKGGGVPYHSPSNKALNITGPSTIVTYSQATQLNEQGVTTVHRFTNGFKLWGNRTAAYPGVTDPKDSFIPARRMFDYLETALVLSTWQKVDDPTNKRLINSVVTSINQSLNGWVARGALLSGQVLFFEQDNPAADLANGIIRFRIQATPPLPAEHIEYTFELDTTGFATLFQ